VISKILDDMTLDWDYASERKAMSRSYSGRIVFGWYFFIMAGENGWTGFVENKIYAFKRFEVSSDDETALTLILNKMKAFIAVVQDFRSAVARESSDHIYNRIPSDDAIIGLSGPYGSRINVIEDRVGGWHAIGGGRYCDMVSRVITMMGL
jgi:hypothetical protein